eukprot:gene11620-15559_t
MNGTNIYRIYHQTVQRQAVDIKSLNSNGCFLLTKDDEKEVIGWIGSMASTEDSDLLRELGIKVMRIDYHKKHTIEIPIIKEGLEIPQYLQVALDLLWSDSHTYTSKLSVRERSNAITNGSISVGLITSIVSNKTNPNIFTHDFEEFSFAHPDTHGKVPRVNFPSTLLKENSIAYINIGSQWDLWIARGVKLQEEKSVINFLEETLSFQLADNVAFKKELLAQFIQKTYQGEERVMFRRSLKIFTDFEPIGRTVPRKIDHNNHKNNIINNNIYNNNNNINNNDNNNFVGNFFIDPKNTTTTSNNNNDNNNNNNNQFNTFPTKPLPENIPNSSNGASFFQSLQQIEEKDDDEDDNNNEENGIVEFENALPNKSKYISNGKALISSSITPYCVNSLTELSIITTEMLVIYDHYSIGPDERKLLLNDAAQNPSILLGWQIEIDEGIYSGVFIISGIRKSFLRKSFFFLRALDGDEFW